jgi:AhpD family alkylhydroperoxidase
MQDRFGRVLPHFDRIPDEFVDVEWDLMKRVQFDETLIPKRYKELIALAVTAAGRCPYGAAVHSELARLHGATEAEIEEALRVAKLASGWGVLMTGLQVDPRQFGEEVARAVAYATAPTFAEGGDGR